MTENCHCDEDKHHRSVTEKLNEFVGDNVTVQIMIYKLALERECFV